MSGRKEEGDEGKKRKQWIFMGVGRIYDSILFVLGGLFFLFLASAGFVACGWS